MGVRQAIIASNPTYPLTQMLKLEHTYATDLDDGFWIPWRGADVPDAQVVLLNHELADELGLDAEALASDQGAALLSGMEPPDGAQTIAQAYAGHQFGGFSPRLGDGRALLLGELIDRQGQRRDLHLKGSGRTPFSRGGDGKAVLGPVLREYLIGEAMHALGVPTTRALAVVTTGEKIVRAGGPKPGAILARVASSHLRIGTFEYLSARRDHDRVRQLVDYAIHRHDPHLMDADDPALELLKAVRGRQARLVAEWMGVGFIHGVMNTDNTTISGETIDYGPCAFMDGFDPATVFSSIDHHGRYAYGSQPSIMNWNLARLAETLLPIMAVSDQETAIEIATAEVDAFGPLFLDEWASVMRAKLGLQEARDGDGRLAGDLLDLMAPKKVDFTQAFRALSDALRGRRSTLDTLFSRSESFEVWFDRWTARVDSETGGGAEAREACAARMNDVNPVYIPRNHLVEEALAAAEDRLDLGPARLLLEVLERPFTERPGLARFTQPAPDDFGPYVTFCGT